MANSFSLLPTDRERLTCSALSSYTIDTSMRCSIFHNKSAMLSSIAKKAAETVKCQGFTDLLTSALFYLKSLTTTAQFTLICLALSRWVK
ncbi:MAG: hypothetical protein JXR97_06510 [Planctomycetes bacterium]|nr:hypothetical protein [Planctomycetota bacterium]